MTQVGHALTPEDGMKGARAAAIVRERKAVERRQRAVAIATLVDGTEDLARLAFNQTIALLGTLDPAMPCETWLDQKRAIEVAEATHRIYRLASGQSTSNVAHASLSDEERAAHRAELLARLGPPLPTDT